VRPAAAPGYTGARPAAAAGYTGARHTAGAAGGHAVVRPPAPAAAAAPPAAYHGVRVCTCCPSPSVVAADLPCRLCAQYGVSCLRTIHEGVGQLLLTGSNAFASRTCRKLPFSPCAQPLAPMAAGARPMTASGMTGSMRPAMRPMGTSSSHGGGRGGQQGPFGGRPSYGAGRGGGRGPVQPQSASAIPDLSDSRGRSHRDDHDRPRGARCSNPGVSRADPALARLNSCLLTHTECRASDNASKQVQDPPPV